jgi:carbonic anhydrase/acetyltransferase-like protein (isoleucine patch superfamily)
METERVEGMLISHSGKSPRIAPSVYVAPTATVCGNVKIGSGSRIMFGACIIAEGKEIEIGKNCIVMENAVIRSTVRHRTEIGAHCLIGPNAHLVGCTLGECVFVATGASVFHGAILGYGCEVRINGVVHLRTTLARGSVVPIGWIAVGSPARILPPDQHEEIWAIQKTLNFPRYVYGVNRTPEGRSNVKEITKKRSRALASHRSDMILR